MDQPFDLVAGSASMLGLVFSFLAMIQADRASRAAAAARDSIAYRTLAEDLERHCTLAQSLVDLLHHERHQEANLRVTDLVGGLSELPKRRSPFLSDNVKNTLKTSRTQLEGLSRVLDKQGGPVAEDRRHVLRVVRTIHANLCESLGVIKAEVDAGR